MKNWFFFILGIFFFQLANAQTTDSTVEDTLYFEDMDPVIASAGIDLAEYKRMTRIVKKVLPYAKLSAAKLRALEDGLASITDNKAKKKYIKEAEKTIKNMYMAQLKNLTIDEGKVLIKLIHRETGQTTWQIMKRFRGSAESLMWQSFGKLYGHNMKSEFDPTVDFMIENIIKANHLE